MCLSLNVCVCFSLYVYVYSVSVYKTRGWGDGSVDEVFAAQTLEPMPER